MIAVAQITPVYSATEFPAKDPTKTSENRMGVIQYGNVRRGTKLAVKPDVIRKSNCAEGWYELADGSGFICGKFLTNDENHRELRTSPRRYNDRPLPYDYGFNLTNGAPLYRRLPSREERRDAEKALAIGKGAKGPEGEGGKDAPWYLKKTNGKPTVTFDEMRGESGLIPLRMVKGFYVAIGGESGKQGSKYWVTTDGFFAPQDHIKLHATKTEFEGVKLVAPGETKKLPIGFVLGLHTKKYFFDEIAAKAEDQKRPRKGDKVERFTVFGLTGKRAVYENQPYIETTEGFYVRGVDITQTHPGPVPAGIKGGEKWIDVDLKSQTLVAFEGDKPVYVTLVSTGRHNDTDPARDYRTKPGDYRIYAKHVSVTMDDDAASDGPYSIQDVPWTMYFHGSMALHGAFWHSQFGRERSHGCVNLQPIDAKNIFEWAGPVLPQGWHGVKATEKNQGTRVIVHE